MPLARPSRPGLVLADRGATSPRSTAWPGTPYNHLQYPTDLVLLVVLWRLRYKLSLRDVAEMFLTRGFVFTHETVREWETRFARHCQGNWLASRRGGYEILSP